MEKKDTNKLLTILKIAYPSAYKNITVQDAQATLALYYKMFKGYPTEIVVEALESYIRTNEYPPTVAGLQKRIDTMVEIVTDSKRDSGMLWGEFKKAIKNYNGFNSKELFENAPEEVRGFLVEPGRIKEYGLLDSEKVNTVVKGQFDRYVNEKNVETEKIAHLNLTERIKEQVKLTVNGPEKMLGVANGE